MGPDIDFQQTLTPEAAASLVGAYTQANAAIEAANIQKDATIRAASIQADYTLYSSLVVFIAALIAYAAARLQVRPSELERALSIAAYRNHLRASLVPLLADSHVLMEDARRKHKFYTDNPGSYTLAFYKTIEQIDDLKKENRKEYSQLGLEIVESIQEVRKYLSDAIIFQNNVVRDHNKYHESTSNPSYKMMSENDSGAIDCQEEIAIEQYVSSFENLFKSLVRLNNLLRYKTKSEYYGLFAPLQFFFAKLARKVYRKIRMKG